MENNKAMFLHTPAAYRRLKVPPCVRTMKYIKTPCPKYCDIVQASHLNAEGSYIFHLVRDAHTDGSAPKVFGLIAFLGIHSYVVRGDCEMKMITCNCGGAPGAVALQRFSKHILIVSIFEIFGY